MNEASAHVPGRENLAALREANTAFHAAVARASGNDRLAAIAIRVMDELDRLLYLKQVGVVWERIDATAAERAAYAHVVPNHRGVIDALISSPGLRSIDLVTV